MRNFIFGILILNLISSQGFSASQGFTADYLKLVPQALATKCASGQLAFDSGGNLLNYCFPNNTWNAFSVSATTPMTTLGDIIYENSTPVPARLAGNITSTKKYLSQTGTGSISAAPSWAQPACGDLSNSAASCSTDATNASNISSGTLATLRGGTGTSTQFNAGAVVFSGSSTAYAQDVTASNQFFWDKTNHRLGLGTTTPSQQIDLNGNIAIDNGGVVYAGGSGNPATRFLTNGMDDGGSGAGWHLYDNGNGTASGVSYGFTSSQGLGMYNPSSNALAFATNGNAALTLASDQSATFANTVNATTFVGALTGTASGNLTYSANNHGVVLSGSGNTAAVLAPSSSTAFPLVSGGSSANPSWTTLTIAGGGTNSGAALVNNRVIVSSSGTIGEFSAGTSGQFLESQGSGSAPIWGSALSNPMTTAGDIIYSNPGSTPVRLGIGSSGSVLTVNSGNTLPSWQASASAPTGSYSQAYFGSASTWSTTSNSFADPTNSGGNTLTVRQSSGITLTAAGSNGCGITFTPGSNTQVFLISATIGISSSGGFNVGFRMTDGSTVIAVSPGIDPFTNEFSSVTITGIYAPANTSANTVKLQLATTSGTATIGPNATSGSITAEWSVIQIK